MGYKFIVVISMFAWAMASFFGFMIVACPSLGRSWRPAVIALSAIGMLGIAVALWSRRLEERLRKLEDNRGEPSERK